MQTKRAKHIVDILLGLGLLLLMSYQAVGGLHNSKTSAEYYYQLRCNIVHSGKKHPTDIAFLESSLNELLHIFKEVLEISFDPVRYDEYDLGEW